MAEKQAFDQSVTDANDALTALEAEFKTKQGEWLDKLAADQEGTEEGKQIQGQFEELEKKYMEKKAIAEALMTAKAD